MDEGQLLLLWPGEVRRKGEGDLGQIGPAMLAGKGCGMEKWTASLKLQI